MHGWLTAMRIARREARRAKGRSALVVALIGVPALALTFAAVSYDMFTLTTQEQLTRDLGTADVQLDWYGEPVEQRDSRGQAAQLTGGESAAQPSEDPAGAPTVAEVRALVPTAERIATHQRSMLTVTTTGGIGEIGTASQDLDDPLFRGMVAITDGRAPAGASEVALTEPAAARLGAGIGDRVEAADTGEWYTVVGKVEYPDELTNELMVFAPDQLPGGPRARQWLVDTAEPVTWDQVQQLNRHGLTAYSRAVALDPPAEVRAFESSWGVNGEAFGVGVLIGGLGTLEIVLLAGPAFAIGARQRQRQLALVAVAGGKPAHLRRIVLADGVVLGALGAVVGVTLGVAAAFLARPLLEEYVMVTRAGGYRVFPLALAGIAVAAVGTGVLAAIVPAFTAARQQVVAALAGRRGITGARKRWLMLGLVLVAIGAAVSGFGASRVSATVVVAGLGIAQLGLVLCTPSIVGLAARLGSRLPLAPRIALRDTARNRSSAAPAISAVMAAVAGAATVGMVMVTLDQDGTEWHSVPPGDAIAGLAVEPGSDTSDGATVEDLQQAARAALPVDETYQLSSVACQDGTDGCYVDVVVPEEQRCPYWEVPQPLSAADQRAASRDPRCDSEVVPFGRTSDVDAGPALAVRTPADPGELAAAAAVLREGGAVVTDQRFLSNGTVTLRAGHSEDFDHSQGGPASVTVPGYLMPLDYQGVDAVISPDAVRALGLREAPGPVLIATTRMPTQQERDAFEAAVSALGAWGLVETEPPSNVDPMLIVLAAAAGVIALGAAGIATGLAAADRRPDLSTLGAVGASPRVRRSLSLSQAGVIAGLGTGLGLAVGLGAATAVLVALNQRYANTWPSPDPYPITVPWPVVAALLVVPVVAMLGAGLLTRSRLPIERRPT